jgi:hypothetical protein
MQLQDIRVLRTVMATMIVMTTMMRKIGLGRYLVPIIKMKRTDD